MTFTFDTGQLSDVELGAFNIFSRIQALDENCRQDPYSPLDPHADMKFVFLLVSFFSVKDG